MAGYVRSRQRRSRLALLLLLGLVAGNRVASGEPRYPRCEKSATCAHDLHAAAESWSAGKSEQALAHWQSAFNDSQDPHLLLRIAQVHEKLYQPELAIESYRRFLQRTPADVPERDWVIHQVRLLLEAPSVEAPPRVRPQPLASGAMAPSPHCSRPAARSKAKLIAGYTFLGLSTVGLIVSAALLAEDGKQISPSGCMDGARAAPCLADTAPGYIVGLPLSSAGIVAGSLLLVSGYKHSDTMQGMAKCAEAH